MHEIKIYAKDEAGEFNKIIREGIEEECNITIKLLPCFIHEIYKCWCDKCDDRSSECKKTLTVIFDDLEYKFIEHRWVLGGE